MLAAMALAMFDVLLAEMDAVEPMICCPSTSRLLSWLFLPAWPTVRTTVFLPEEYPGYLG